jgi:hypothetical protein
LFALLQKNLTLFVDSFPILQERELPEKITVSSGSVSTDSDDNFTILREVQQSQQSIVNCMTHVADKLSASMATINSVAVEALRRAQKSQETTDRAEVKADAALAEISRLTAELRSVKKDADRATELEHGSPLNPKELFQNVQRDNQDNLPTFKLEDCSASDAEDSGES